MTRSRLRTKSEFLRLQARPGEEQQIYLGDLKRHYLGRPAYIAVMRWTAELELEITPDRLPRTPNGDPELPSPEWIYTALDPIILQTEDHHWLRAVDGLDLATATYLRTGTEQAGTDLDVRQPVEGEPGEPLRIRVPFDLIFDLRRPYGHWRARYDDCLPLDFFDDRRGGDDVLSLRWSRTLGGYPGIEVLSYRDVQLQLQLVMLDDVREPPHWALRRLSEETKRLRLQPEGAIDFLLLTQRRPRESAESWRRPIVPAVDQIELTIANDVIYQGRPAEHLYLEAQLDRMGPLGALPWRPESAPWVPVICAPLGTRRTQQTRGPVRLVVDERGHLDELRALWWESGHRDLVKSKKFMQRLGLPIKATDPSRVAGAAETVTADGGGEAAHSILPQRVMSADLTYAVPRQRAQQKGAA